MKPVTKSVSAFLILFTTFSCSKKVETNSFTVEQAKVKIQELINDAVNSDFPGISVSVRSNNYNYTLFAGKADLTTNLNYSENSLNYMHSISKTFTAVAILKLKEQGLINLNAPINQYLDPTICNNITNGNIITVRQLLNMKSGIADYLDNPQFFTDAQTGTLPMPSSQMLQYVYNKPAHFVPGSSFEYSNINYHLLALIIDKIIQGNHRDYITNNIINQYHLSETYYIPQSNFVSAPINTVSSYSSSIVPNQITDISELQFGVVKSSIGDDGIISTTNDIAKFYELLLRDKTLVNAASLSEMMAPDNTLGQAYYGMGVYSYRISTGQLAIGHDGSGAGAAAEAWYFPEKGVTVSLATNVWSLDDNDPKILKYYQLWDKVTKLILAAK